MQPTTLPLVLSLLSIISSAAAQAATGPAAAAPSPDGLIVPFTSGLPVCASKCGPLFDVQGACSPPATQAIDQNCFCNDSRLTVFNNEGGVSLVCGPQSCTDPTQQQALKTCKPKAAAGNNNASWISGHYQWVIMIVVIFFAIVFGWIGACLFRRRYLRKKEREIEMKPPVAWGPHQMQGATGGYQYGDGVADTSRGGPGSAGGYAKEYAAAAVTPADGRKAKRESKGLHKKTRTRIRAGIWRSKESGLRIWDLGASSVKLNSKGKGNVLLLDDGGLSTKRRGGKSL
ncbi:hypothetical protein VTL71DRAFT_11954 [Oculimacula yallundae]|uniref:Integral membrane protein n=1 Tax=Oculimacula yallundae TaxID=86028 RepID=A0ABR4CRL0_9HELO